MAFEARLLPSPHSFYGTAVGVVPDLRFANRLAFGRIRLGFCSGNRSLDFIRFLESAGKSEQSPKFHSRPAIEATYQVEPKKKGYKPENKQKDPGREAGHELDRGKCDPVAADPTSTCARVYGGDAVIEKRR
jgi:hypothetical protein